MKSGLFTVFEKVRKTITRMRTLLTEPRVFFRFRAVSAKGIRMICPATIGRSILSAISPSIETASSAGSPPPVPLARSEMRRGLRNIPSTFERDALNMVATAFPPEIWVKTVQLETVVGRQARAKIPIRNSGPMIPRSGSVVRKK